MAASDLFYAEVLLLLLVPTVLGILLTKWVGDAAHRRGSSHLVVRILRLVVTVAWVSVVVTGAYVTFGPFSFLSTLTFSGVAAIAVTLALQTTLQNFISGFILMRERFLRVGDLVQFSGIKGTVVGLGLVTVMIKMPDGSLAAVSYSNLLSGPMINFTASSRLAGEY